ncbi:MAG: hypothetical protein JWM73_1136 [Solirubrobacterales bacterium]|nr:hypothetical protein [Solirubrobacterales bacterium]
MPGPRLLPVAITLALAVPAAAQGATVSLEPGPVVRYVAGTGETNRLTLAYSADGSGVTVTDPGATIAVEGCLSIDLHTARCDVERELITGLPASVALGDGDDSLSVTSPQDSGYQPVHADGGPGDDTLRGTPGDDVIHGGAGNDSIVGGAGDDLVAGDDGDDLLDLSTGTDSPLCGAGSDLVVEPAVTVVVPADCERLRYGDARVGITVDPTPVRATRNALRFRLACPKDSIGDLGEATPCAGRLRLLAPRTDTLLGVGRFSDDGAGSFGVSALLTPRGRALIAAGNGRRVRVVVSGDFRSRRWTIAL